MTGKAKAQHLMWFVQEHASFRFEFPNEDPHLTEDQCVRTDIFTTISQHQCRENAAMRRLPSDSCNIICVPGAGRHRYVLKQEQLKERAEQMRRKEEEEEAQAEQRRKEAERADADSDGHDDCPWAGGCDDEDEKDL